MGRDLGFHAGNRGAAKARRASRKYILLSPRLDPWRAEAWGKCARAPHSKFLTVLLGPGRRTVGGGTIKGKRGRESPARFGPPSLLSAMTPTLLWRQEVNVSRAGGRPPKRGGVVAQHGACPDTNSDRTAAVWQCCRVLEQEGRHVWQGNGQLQGCNEWNF
jgi:hypothetical protein